MNIKRLPIIFTLAMGLVTPTARADRPIERREDASHVVCGVVRAVYVSEGKSYRRYVVELEIASVEKGTELKRSHVLYASCYRRKADASASLDADSSGHSVVPQEAQLVRVFLNHDRGRFEGVYPNWLEHLGNQPAAPSGAPAGAAQGHF